MLARTFSATLLGIDGIVIDIEAALQNQLPGIQITGLPGEIIKESRDRVRTCLENLGFDIPSSRILIHLSPASARKQGSQFDLPIAISALMAEGLLRSNRLPRTALLGELSLDGRVHRVAGALSLIEALDRCTKIDTILVPAGNAVEASLIQTTKVRLVETLPEALAFLEGRAELPAVSPSSAVPLADATATALDQVRGQNLAKRALEISLAGRHHLLLVGPPGVGKSMLASCAPALLPPLTPRELVEVVKNYSQCPGAKRLDLIRPFRSPHHSVSGAALLGGGSATVIPGEVTLAHGGVLFLDEFPEFRRDVIEGLREPMQNGKIHLHRIGHSLTLPARFTLIAAMNPCPCGYSMSHVRRCSCTRERVTGYRRRISGPIVDRMDLCVVLSASRLKEEVENRYPQGAVKERILSAAETQKKRFADTTTRCNGDAGVDMPGFELGEKEKNWLGKVSEESSLSYRSLFKIIRVARTIADLDGKESIGWEHLQEAWGLRCPDFSAMAPGL